MDDFKISRFQNFHDFKILEIWDANERARGSGDCLAISKFGQFFPVSCTSKVVFRSDFILIVVGENEAEDIQFALGVALRIRDNDRICILENKAVDIKIRK